MMAELDTTESLKACPFCGGKAETHSELNVVPEVDPRTGAYIGADMYYYEHTGRPTCDIWFDICEDEPEGTTIEMWNRRV